VRGIENLDAILDVEGIDATMIGPYDLSASVGKPGAFDDPAVAAALATYETVSKRRGRAMGAHLVETSVDGARARMV
jgi:2-keto-3-deoxy-L-rhamnonate aldolase RhmA